MSEKSKIESLPRVETESQPERFDKFMVPEDWIEDLSEAQKEAYRVKVCALSFKKTKESLFPETKTEDDQPSPYDYKNGELVYRDFYAPRSKKEFEEMDELRKITNFVGGNIAMAYIELRARILARSERMKETGK